METILAAGLQDYYRYRQGPAVSSQNTASDSSTAAITDLAELYDTPELAEQFVRPAGNPANAHDRTACLSVEGIRCGACVWLLERRLSALPGVRSVSVNASTARARITFDPAETTLGTLVACMARVGYPAVPLDDMEREAQRAQEARRTLQRLFVAGIGMMQVMMFALPAYLSGPAGLDDTITVLLNWASFIMTTPVVLFSAAPFFAGAWRDVRAASPGMDVPVSLGIAAAFLVSANSTWQQTGDTYFDSVSMFVFLLLLARSVEWWLRERARRAIESASLDTPEYAERWNIQSEQFVRVPAVQLSPGDCIRVREGDRLPVDSVLLDVMAEVDLSLLNGESAARTVSRDSSVPGGAVVLGTAAEFRVERGQSQSLPGLLSFWVAHAGAEKPQSARLADRVAGWFVTVLLGFALLVYVVWQILDPARAALVAMTVLVVSCPCALSLATPAALTAITARLLRRGVLIVRGHVVESAARISDVVLDKTGTLTEGRPRVCQVQGGAHHDEDALLRLAASLESGTRHPLAEGLVAAARQRELDEPAIHCVPLPQWRDVHYQAGHGVVATGSDGHEYRVGSARACGVRARECEAWRTADNPNQADCSEVFVVRRRAGCSVDIAPTVLGRLLLRDTLREHSLRVVGQLQRAGLRVHLLSGDRARSVERVAASLGIEHCLAEATPDAKAETIRQLQAQGRSVLMVGDGVNDAPALACADVSLAVGDAIALAQHASDVVALKSGVEPVADVLLQSRRAVAVMRQNLMWALLYNSVAIPMAALGFVPPWAAAVGMAFSSLLVVGNSARLWRVDSSSHPV